MVGEPTLSRGDVGEWVTYLQQMLAHRQLGSGFTDGTYCDATEHAVRALQQQHSLPDSGQCDEATWQKLTTEPEGSAGHESAREHEGSAQHASSATGMADVPDDIAISLQIQVDAPHEELVLTELEPLSDNARHIS